MYHFLEYQESCQNHPYLSKIKHSLLAFVQATLRQEGLIGQLRAQRLEPVTLSAEEDLQTDTAATSGEQVTTFSAPSEVTGLLGEKEDG